ncbi:MAG: hypothetical protein LBN98_03750 [Prevotellaceae bacterium]|jgi:hypothetical protein|nr:hypothetical protein [Prevotellaceae bacterium]
MNSILKNSITASLLAGASLLAACHREEDPFAGTDSYITGFRLQQGDAVFHAAITGEVITVTAPEGFSLNRARATVTLSENAKIYPDPASITSWDEEQAFAVTAHSGAQTAWKYTVRRSGVAHSGAVLLETQADVDAFGRRGVTLIDGSLIIGRTAGTDSITSLAPLASLKEVSYALTLNPTCAITSLEGLENLEHTGGLLKIGETWNNTLPHLETVTLPALKTAGALSIGNPATVIVELPGLEHVSKQLELGCPLYQLHLPGLQSAGSISMNVYTSTSTSLAKISLPALEAVEGNILLEGWGSVTKVELPALRKTGGFSVNAMPQLVFIYTPKLEAAAATMTFSSLDGLTELSFPALKQAGAMNINCKNISILEVPKLETLKALTLQNTPLNGIAGFTALKTAGTVTLTNLPGGTAVHIPASVQHIDVLEIGLTTAGALIPEVHIAGKNIGTLRLTGRAVQTKISGDETFAGLLYLQPNSSDLLFPELEGLGEVDSLYVNAASAYDVHIKGIRKVRRGVYLGTLYSGYPRTFSMPDMEEIGGHLTVNFPYMTNTAMDSVKWDNLKSVGGNLTLTINTKTAKVLHCPALTTVGGDFKLSTGYDYSTTYRGFETLNFPKLATIGGKLTVYPGTATAARTNTKLTGLHGFSALTGVKAIEITRQAALTDYSGLQKAFPSLASPENWTASGNSYNPSYRDLLDGKWIYE